MVTARSLEMSDLVRWGGVLTLSLVAHGYLFSAIDLSAKPNPIPPVEQIQISLQALAAPKSEPVAEATPSHSAPPEPVAAEEPVEKVITPASLPEPPAPVKPTVDVETQELAAVDWTKFEPTEEIIKPTETEAEPVQQTPPEPELEPVQKSEPIPTPHRIAKKPSLPEPPKQIAQKPVSKPQPTVEPVKLEKPMQEPKITKLDPAPVTKPVEKPVEKKAEPASPPSLSSVSNDHGESSSTVIQNAKYRKRTPPNYPRRAYDLGQQGMVTLTALVEPNGKTGQLKVETSSGHRMLDKAALAAVKKWEFEPLVRNGVRVSSWVRVPVRFVIN